MIDRMTFPENVAAGMLARGFEPGSFRRILAAETHEAASDLTADLRSLFESWGLSTDGFTPAHRRTPKAQMSS
jgi:hypothetical protein